MSGVYQSIGLGEKSSPERFYEAIIFRFLKSYLKGV